MLLSFRIQMLPFGKNSLLHTTITAIRKSPFFVRPVPLIQYAREEMGIRAYGIFCQKQLANFSRAYGNSSKWESETLLGKSKYGIFQFRKHFLHYFLHVHMLLLHEPNKFSCSETVSTTWLSGSKSKEVVQVTGRTRYGLLASYGQLCGTQKPVSKCFERAIMKSTFQ